MLPGMDDQLQAPNVAAFGAAVCPKCGKRILSFRQRHPEGGVLSATVRCEHCNSSIGMNALDDSLSLVWDSDCSEPDEEPAPELPSLFPKLRSALKPIQVQVEFHRWKVRCCCGRSSAWLNWEADYQCSWCKQQYDRPPRIEKSSSKVIKVPSAPKVKAKYVKELAPKQPKPHITKVEVDEDKGWRIRCRCGLDSKYFGWHDYVCPGCGQKYQTDDCS